jgi:apolipoprotein N-acyltransferase
MLIVCAYQAGLFVLLGWLFARGSTRGWPLGFVFTAAFAAAETAFPLLFPFTFGATMHDVFPIVQAAELGGPVLVALIVLASSWAFSKGLSVYFARRRSGSKVGLVAAFDEVGWLNWAPLLLIPTVAVVYGMIRIVQVDEAVHQADKVRVGIVQANMSLVAKRNDREEGLKRHVKLTRQLVNRENIELVVWPETSVAGAVRVDRANQYYQKKVTRQLKVPAIVGAVLYENVDDVREQVLYNSALIADEKGKIRGRYDKQFLLLFGEYLPFGDRFPILHQWSPQSGRFTPGTSFEPLTHDGHDIATFICYEDIVPSFVNKLMKHGNPELLVNMTNDAWFGDSTEPWEHMALAKLRAVEQRRYLVRSTNSGVSGFVDPVGRLSQRTKTFHEAAVAEDVAWLQLGSPYRLWGNAPWWLLTALAFAMAFVKRPVSRDD